MSDEPSIIVSADGRPRKRQRVSQACERCRAKKYRCDGAGPPCAACHSAGTACSYGQAGQRRGLKTGYVKVLEMLWGLVLEEVPNSEHVTTRLLATLSREDLDSNSQPALQTWRSSGLPSSIASLLDDEPSQHHHGENARSPSITLPWSLDSAAPPQGPPAHPLTSNEPSTLPANPQTVFPSIAQTVLPTIEEPAASPALPPEWHLLVQAYLSYEESWLPVLQKSAVWRIAYAYEASLDTSSRRGLQACGDFATLWASLVLGDLHMNGATSAGADALQTHAHALLTTPSSSEPDASYAPAFLLWSVIHMGRREFTLSKMKLVQAFVLAASHPPPIPSMDGESLLSNACFVMDVLLALATNSKPLDIGSNSPAGVGGERESLDWEPFIDPLRQQQNSSHMTALSQSRPSQTYSTYGQFLKLCTLLYTVSQGTTLWSHSESSFDDWFASLPGHLKSNNWSSSSDQCHRLPSEANIRIFSLLFCSRLAASRTGTSGHDFNLTYDKPTGTEITKMLSSLQQQWDVRRLPLSFGTVIHLLSVDVSKQPVDPCFENTRPSLRRLIADFATHYSWRLLENEFELTSVPNDNLTVDGPLAGNPSVRPTTTCVNMMPHNREVAGASADQGVIQQDHGEALDTHPTCNHPIDRASNSTTVFSEPDFGCLVNEVMADPMISNLDDSAFPGAYLDLFDADESGNRDFMRALGFLDDTDGLCVTAST